MEKPEEMKTEAMKEKIEQQREEIIAIIDKYLPADGVGTGRERARSEMYNDLSEFTTTSNPKTTLLESAKMIHFDLAIRAHNLMKQHGGMSVADFREMTEVKKLWGAMDVIEELYLQE